jgi:hypothetical protein
MSTPQALRIEDLPFALAMRDEPLVFAAVGAIHLLGVALLVGTIVAFDLRVLGLSRSLPLRSLARHLLPVALVSMILIVPTGLAMFATRASDLLLDGMFSAKIGLIFAHGLLALAFHLGPFRSVNEWDTEIHPPITAKACAIASLLGWICVLVLGRFVATSTV